VNFKEHFLYNESMALLRSDDMQYNKVIAQALFGDQTKVANIPQPIGNYQLGVDFKVDTRKNRTTKLSDLDIFKKLFPVTPPKKGEEVGESAGTKGSGNGEIALYWLLSKLQDVRDTRGSDSPDLAVTPKGGKEVGLEVKSFKVGTTRIPLGRFESQGENLKLLSIIFGVQVLLGDNSTITRKKGPPSITTFDKTELVSAFSTITTFINNKQLRAIANQFLPIQTIYQQVDWAVSKLGLIPGKFTAEDGAAAMLRMLLTAKLDVKPGFGGYIVNITPNGDAEFYHVDSNKINSLTTEELLNGVYAKSAALYINMSLFSK